MTGMLRASVAIARYAHAAAVLGALYGAYRTCVDFAPWHLALLGVQVALAAFAGFWHRHMHQCSARSSV